MPVYPDVSVQTSASPTEYAGYSKLEVPSNSIIASNRVAQASELVEDGLSIETDGFESLAEPLSPNKIVVSPDSKYRMLVGASSSKPRPLIRPKSRSWSATLER